MRRPSRRQQQLQRQIRQQIPQELDDAEVLARQALLAQQIVPVVVAFPQVAAPVEVVYLVAVPDLLVEAALDQHPMVLTERS